MLPEPLDKEAFATKLHAMLSPAEPVRTPERLLHREKQLRTIERALYAPGRHVFVYGDRGVGKSSLAATAANQYQSAESAYLDVSCSPDATFRSVIASIASRAVADEESFLRATTRKETREVDLKWLKMTRSRDVTSRKPEEMIRGVADAVEVLREVAALHSSKPIVVIDEFDRLMSRDERALFADLLKQLGDKEVNIKFIFTGVAKSLDELLGAHQSAIRQLETLHLDKLSWEGRWEIVVGALRSFGVEIDRNTYIRIAAVSDGYPFYVHLIAEKLLWRLWDRSDTATSVQPEDFVGALNDAIESISAELKRPYEAATVNRSQDYEYVLWASADSEFLHAYLRGIFTSYSRIVEHLGGQPLSYSQFRTRLRNLTKENYGEVLVPDPKRPGLYTYRENMLRGYVRLQAEAHGIRLSGYDPSSEEEQQIHVPARASTGYRGPTVPRGVTFRRG